MIWSWMRTVHSSSITSESCSYPPVRCRRLLRGTLMAWRSPRLTTLYYYMSADIRGTTLGSIHQKSQDHPVSLPTSGQHSYHRVTFGYPQFRGYSRSVNNVVGVIQTGQVRRTYWYWLPWISVNVPPEIATPSEFESGPIDTVNDGESAKAYRIISLKRLLRSNQFSKFNHYLKITSQAPESELVGR